MPSVGKISSSDGRGFKATRKQKLYIGHDTLSLPSYQWILRGKKLFTSVIIIECCISMKVNIYMTLYLNRFLITYEKEIGGKMYGGK